MSIMKKVKAALKKVLPKALSKRFGMAHRKHHHRR
jgi:hypothetical protein